MTRLALLFICLYVHTLQAQLPGTVSIRAREYNGSSEGAPLEHFHAQVAIYPLQGTPYVRDQECDDGCVFDQLPKGSTLVFTATKEDQPRDSVGTFDLVLINQHILKVGVFDHPARWIAADADCNGLIEPMDIVVLRKLILKIDTSFCHSWTLIDAAALLPPNPLEADLPREITVKNYDGTALDLEFWAIKTGNVNLHIPDQKSGRPAPGAFVAPPQPNPTAGSVWFGVQLPEPATLELEVFDALGRRVYADRVPGQAGAQQLELPAAAFPVSGAYFWRITAAGQQASGTIVRR